MPLRFIAATIAATIRPRGCNVQRHKGWRRSRRPSGYLRRTKDTIGRRIQSRASKCDHRSEDCSRRDRSHREGVARSRHPGQHGRGGVTGIGEREVRRGNGLNQDGRRAGSVVPVTAIDRGERMRAHRQRGECKRHRLRTIHRSAADRGEPVVQTQRARRRVYTRSSNRRSESHRDPLRRRI